MEFDGVFFDTKDFIITEKKLGKGVFGAVYLAERTSDHQICAAKIIDVLKDIDGKSQMMIMRESSILSKLHHRSIIKFFGLNFRSLSDRTKYQPTIITEFMSNKSLKELLDKEKSGLADKIWDSTKKYICLIGIADAMRYLHSHGILHRDLKPENILMDKDFYPKVCDFGLARCLPNHIEPSLDMTSHIGSPLYMAPELINGDDEYGKGVDVYAFAILTYEILTGRQPFYELGEKCSPSEIWQKVSDGGRPKFTRDIPVKMRSFIKKCWSQDPDERPSFDEIFNELSTDLTYSPVPVDEDEIKNFLEFNDEPIGIEDKKIILSNKYIEIEKNRIQKNNDFNLMLNLACETENIEFLECLLSDDSIDINSTKITYLLIE